MPRRGAAIPVALIVLAIVVVAVWDPVAEWAFGRIRHGTGEEVSTRLPLCMRASDQSNCVVDGDTLKLEGESIRLADIDAPEVFSFECAAEKTRGEEATRRLQELINAGPFVVTRSTRDVDRYGRKLRVLSRDGQSLGLMLADEGLAQRWGRPEQSWC